MSETVFILGAGASQHAGAPVMKHFLDTAEDLKKREEFLPDWEQDDFDLIFRGINALKEAQAKSQIDLGNIESVFAAFEMGGLAERLGTIDTSEVKRLSKAMKCMIVRTLEESVRFRAETDRVSPPIPYGTFVKLIRRLVTKGTRPDFERVSVITFNYDVGLDYALFWEGLPVEYAIEGEEEESGIKLLKLHGSLNWTRCPDCKKVVAWYMKDFCREYRWDRGELDPEEPWKFLRVASLLNSFKHCGDRVADEPIIVPPTWNKGQYHEQLELVWRAAASELANAENIFICGYSLPDTDQFFRYLYAVGTMGEALLRRFWVYDPDTDVEARFRGLLGPMAVSRFRFAKTTFSGAVPAIAQELRIPREEIVA